MNSLGTSASDNAKYDALKSDRDNLTKNVPIQIFDRNRENENAIKT